MTQQPLGFLNHARTVDYLPGEFVFTDPLGYRTNVQRVPDKSRLLVVPERFITNFASIPWLAQAIPGFSVNGNSRRAAGLHDLLYCTGLFPRIVCDQIFREALLATDHSWTVAQTMYLGVRAGGWQYYNARRDAGDIEKDFVSVEDFARLIAGVPDEVVG